MQLPAYKMSSVRRETVGHSLSYTRVDVLSAPLITTTEHYCGIRDDALLSHASLNWYINPDDDTTYLLTYFETLWELKMELVVHCRLRMQLLIFDTL